TTHLRLAEHVSETGRVCAAAAPGVRGEASEATRAGAGVGPHDPSAKSVPGHLLLSHPAARRGPDCPDNASQLYHNSHRSALRQWREEELEKAAEYYHGATAGVGRRVWPGAAVGAVRCIPEIGGRGRAHPGATRVRYHSRV